MESNITTNFPNKLLELRKKSGLSQQEVADYLGVTRQTVSKWERGISSPCTMLTKKICECYKISSDELLNLPINDNISDETSRIKKRRKTLIKVFIILDLITCVSLILYNSNLIFWTIYGNIVILSIYFMYYLYKLIKNHITK